MASRPLDYHVYYSQQKITQLYKQLPESMFLVQRASISSREHVDAGLNAPLQEEACLQPTHASIHSEEHCYREASFEVNEMHCLRQVLGYLRRTGQLRKCNGVCRPGVYYDIRDSFSALEEDEQTPKGSLWLEAPRIRLLCGRHAFLGENEHPAREVWGCGGTLPLKGAVLCMGYREGVLTGLPLYLAIDA